MRVQSTATCAHCGATFVPKRKTAGKFCSRVCFFAGGPKATMSEEERFWSFVEKTETCWLWSGYVTKDGYGHFSIDGKPIRAHRYSFELCNGPIPDGIFVCHDCPDEDNRRCVNPDHLWLGDNSDNQSDRWAKSRRRERSRIS